MAPPAALPLPPPPSSPPAPVVPGGVERTREELEQLRDEAAAELSKPEPWITIVTAVPGKQARELLRAVQDTTRWLLGECPNAPISGETYDYPYTVRQVGRERTHADDAFNRLAWHHVTRDYAEGVDYTLGWAFADYDGPRPQPGVV